MAVIDRVRELVLPIVADAQAHLYDIELNRGVLRILVDADDGVSIDAIKVISRAASRLLDEVDPIPGRYTLEVSSPGLERRLRTPQHFVSAIGEIVKVKTEVGITGARRCRGTIVSANDTGFCLDGDSLGEALFFRYDDITEARTVFEWGPRTKSGGPNHRNVKNRPSKET